MLALVSLSCFLLKHFEKKQPVLDMLFNALHPFKLIYYNKSMRNTQYLLFIFTFVFLNLPGLYQVKGV